MSDKRMSVRDAAVIFIAFTFYFFLLLFTLLPFLKQNFSLHPVLYWFVCGYFLFIPMPVFSVSSVRAEGYAGFNRILGRLNLRKLSRADLIYSVTGLVFVFILTGLIFGASALLNRLWGIRLLSTTPWFMVMQPLIGSDKLLLLIWFPMFLLNIVGEELLWRGYVQSRLDGKCSWLIISALWMLFHLPFGGDLMIMLVPVIVIIPYVYSKTQNTLTGIFIHGLYNGPIFVLLSLGVLEI